MHTADLWTHHEAKFTPPIGAGDTFLTPAFGMSAAFSRAAGKDQPTQGVGHAIAQIVQIVHECHIVILVKSSVLTFGSFKNQNAKNTNCLNMF